MEVLSRAARNKLVSKIWRANNPDKIRNKNYKDRYGITLDDYNAMLKKQKINVIYVVVTMMTPSYM